MLGLLGTTGCRSTSTVRRGVDSVETAASGKREALLQTAAKTNGDSNSDVVPATFTEATGSADCKH